MHFTNRGRQEEFFLMTGIGILKQVCGSEVLAGNLRGKCKARLNLQRSQTHSQLPPENCALGKHLRSGLGIGISFQWEANI
jgi:hypothetical protein